MPNYTSPDQVVASIDTLADGLYSSTIEFANLFSVGQSTIDKIRRLETKGKGRSVICGPDEKGTAYTSLRELILSEVFVPILRNMGEDYLDFGSLPDPEKEVRIKFLGAAYMIKEGGACDIDDLDYVVHQDPNRGYEYNPKRIMSPEEFICYLFNCDI